jgi:proteasome alpha subunit
MSIPFYVSPEQLMQDKAEYARKGIARGKSIVTLEYDNGILMVAENPLEAVEDRRDLRPHRLRRRRASSASSTSSGRSASASPTSEGYAYSREDVRGKALANAYSQAIGDVFTRR